MVDEVPTPPTRYAAKCERFPNLQMGLNVEFKDGLFVTEREDLWEILKKNDWWNVFIFETEPPAIVPPEPAPIEPPASAPEATAAEGEGSDDEPTFRGVRRGQRGTR